jgi:transposase InsO family protein
VELFTDNHPNLWLKEHNDIEHTKTKVRHPHTNGICERFYKTILQEFSQPALRRKIFHTPEELQADLDEWLKYYNNERTHQGKQCYARTPAQTLDDGNAIWKEKFVN